MLVVVLCVSLAGCASVPAWERGNLAKPQMAFDVNPTESALRTLTLIYAGLPCVLKLTAIALLARTPLTPPPKEAPR